MSDETAPKCDCEKPRTHETGFDDSEAGSFLRCCMKQRSWSMLRTESFSDVCFIVGCEPETKPIRAHKTVLIAGSDVFKTMFDKKWGAKSESVELPDVEPAAFSTLLRFLYTDDVLLTPESVGKVLYLAKKYAVLSLEDQCVNFLHKQLCPGNAFTFLVQATLYDKPRLKEACLNVIDKQPDNAFAAEGFRNIDLATLCVTLKRNTLQVVETNLFEAVMRWASAECERKHFEVNAENQRLVLEDAVYLVRYPLMKQEEFASTVVPSRLLSPEEIVDMFLYYSNNPKPSFRFDKTPRSINGPIIISRFQEIADYPWPCSGNRYDSIGFFFNRNVKLCGFGLYGAYGGGPATYSVSMQVKNRDTSQILSTRDSSTFLTEGLRNTFSILLASPVTLHANVNYIVIFKIQGPASFCGSKCCIANYIDDESGEPIEIVFNDFGGHHLKSETNIRKGQIPEILIKL